MGSLARVGLTWGLHKLTTSTFFCGISLPRTQERQNPTTRTFSRGNATSHGAKDPELAKFIAPKVNLPDIRTNQSIHSEIQSHPSTWMVNSLSELIGQRARTLYLPLRRSSQKMRSPGPQGVRQPEVYRRMAEERQRDTPYHTPGPKRFICLMYTTEYSQVGVIGWHWALYDPQETKNEC